MRVDLAFTVAPSGYATDIVVSRYDGPENAEAKGRFEQAAIMSLAQTRMPGHVGERITVPIYFTPNGLRK